MMIKKVQESEGDTIGVIRSPISFLKEKAAKRTPTYAPVFEGLCVIKVTKYVYD